MSELKLTLPDDALLALKLRPENVVAELRLAAAIKLHEIGRLPASTAASLAGLSPTVFQTRLAEYGPLGSLSNVEKGMADPSVARLEAEVDGLYDQLRDLVARAAREPSLRIRIAEKRRELRALQEQQAKIARRHAEDGLELKPGEGYRMLTHVETLLGR